MIWGVFFLATLFLLRPEATGRYFGYYRDRDVVLLPSEESATATAEDGPRVLAMVDTRESLAPAPSPTFLARLFKPLSYLSLRAVRIINPLAYDRAVTYQEITNINDVITLRENDTLQVAYPLALPSSSYLQIPDQGLVSNLNAEYLQGREPGAGPGDLAVLNSRGNLQLDGIIISPSVSTQALRDGAVTPEKLSQSVHTLFSPQDGSIESADLKDGAVTVNKIGSSAVNSAKIKDGSIVADDIADEAIVSSLIKNGEITTEDLAEGSITTARLADDAVTAAKILDGTITAADLNATLTLAAGDYLDLSAITHDSTALQGLRLPNVGASPSSPTSGEGFIAWDATSDQVLVYDGASWGAITGSSGGAPTNATYLTLSANSTLSAERVLTQGSGITITDAGANTTATIAATLGTSITGSEVDSNTLDFADLEDTLDLDAATEINLGANAFTIDLDSTGDFIVADGGTAFATFADDGTVTLTGTISVPTVTLTGTGTLNGLDAIDATTETTLEGALDIAGDISGTGLGSVTIGADKVLESHLKAVDAAIDEDCLTYESTGGDFEWQTCGGAGGATAWDDIGDPDAAGSIAFAEFAQTMDWNTAATAAAFDGLSVSITNDATTDSLTQRLLVLKNNNATGTAGVTERFLVLDNADTDEAVTTAIEVLASSTGTITTALDVSDAEIGTALAIGANDITTSGATIAASELNLLDSGVTLGELTDSGTLTATTVDINGGNIDGTVIGATTRAAASVTTLDANGNMTIGDASADTLTINAGSTGSGITLANFTSCTALETNSSGVLVCGADDTGAGGTSWSGLTAPGAGLTLAHNANTTDMTWDFSTTADDYWTMAFDNNGGTAGTDRLVVISNAVSTASGAVDLNTEAILVLDQADTTASGTTVVDDALLITNSGGSTLTDAIQIGTGTQAIGTAINIGSTGVTTDISLQNGETISNDTDGTVAISGTTFSIASATALNCSDCIDGDDLADAIALDANTSITQDGTETFTISNTGSGATIIDLTSTGDLEIRDAGTAFATFSDTGALTLTNALAANGGITFDAATDTLGAFTAAGTVNLNTNILENIGNTGTDFIATTGGLTLAGTLTANGAIAAATDADFTLAAAENVVVSNTTMTTADLLALTATVTDTNTADALQITITDNTSSSGVARGLVIETGDGAASLASALAVNHTDTTQAMTAGIEITGAASTAITTALDVDDAEIATALAIGANDITTAATTLASTELDLLDGGVTLGELTNSGTLTATTVDINGGAIDGTAIGATSASTGAFTTLSSTGNTTVGDANSDTLTINAGTSGTGITFADDTFNSCTSLETSATGVLTCGSDADTATAWDAIGDPTASSAIAHAAFTTDMTWDFSTTADDYWTMAFDNNGGTAGADRLVVISNAVSTASTGDLNTEAILVIDQADTVASGTTVVDDGLLITNSGGSTLTDAIQIGSGTQAITNAINIASTGVTTDISLQNAETISNDTDGTVAISGTTFSIASATALNCSDCIDGDDLADAIALDANTSLTQDGTETFTISNTGSGATIIDLTSTGDLEIRDAGTAFATFSDTGALTLTNALAANGGITFDAATDTVGAFTAAGTINMNANILENIGNTGTDFIATTGGLTLAGALTANGAATFNTDVDLTLAAAENLTISNTTASTADVVAVTATITDTNTADALQITITDNTSSSGVARGLVIETGDGGASLNSALAINHTDTTQAMTAGIEITGAASTAVTTALDVDDAEIATALAIGANDITTAATTLASTELDLLDGGVTLGELTNSGTLTATTVDINGGAIDGTAIGASSASTGAFTTLSSTGATTLGNNSTTVAIDGTNFDLTTAGAVSLTGHLTLSGDSGEGLSGGGLTDCDTAATSKLLWDITSNKFSCGTDQGASTLAWSALTAPTTNLSLSHAEFTTAFTWDTAASSAAFDAFTLAMTNDATTDGGNQRVLVLKNNDASGTTGVTERFLVLDNADTDEAVTTAIEILASSTGTITTAIDLSDAEIGTALAIGANNITTAATTVASTELDLLDGGVTLGELTDSGTLTATTVDINGGNIDGTVIGATTRAAGSFTTINGNGNVTIGDANTDTVTINAGSSGTGITFADSTFTTCTALETVSGVLTCGSDAGEGTGASNLKEAYDGDADGSDAIIALTTADDSLIFRNPSASGTDSGYILHLEQLNTGAVDGLRLSESGTGFDITTGTANQDLDISANGTGNIIFNLDADTVFSASASAALTEDLMSVSSSGATVTTDLDALSVAFTQGDDADATDTNAGINVAITGDSVDADTLHGINIANLAGASAGATSTALNIGTGWDTGINVGSGKIVTSNSGVEFTESDTNPTCASGNFTIYADTSENKLKKCENGTASDLDGNMDDVDVFTTAGANTWTKPSNVADVYVEVWGGGEGGITGGANNSGGGGGGGGYSAALTGVDGNETATVGAAGTANGGDGGNSSFTTDGTSVAANGGSGASGLTGGSGGTASGGDLNLTGGAGGTTQTGDGVTGGDGGNSPLGGAGGAGGPGGNIAGANVAGKAGTTPGGAGGGGQEAGAGGAGAIGLIVVWEMTGSITGADLAEWYDTEPDVAIGDAVAIGERTLTYTAGSLGKQNISVLKKAAAGDQLVGVVSSVPSKLMGFDITNYAQHPQPIALSGRVPVKVTSANGPIKSGDLLTASSIPGVAMRATKAGQTIGSALEEYNGPPGEIGEVLILVNTSYSVGARTRTILEQHGTTYSEQEWRKPGIDMGRLMLADMLGGKDELMASSVALSEVHTDRLGAGLEVVTPRVVTDTVAANYLEPALNNDLVLRLDPDKDGKFVIGQGAATTLETLGAEVTPVVTFDALGNATFAGTVTAAAFQIGESAGLETLETKVTQLSERLNAVSAAQVPIWPEASLPTGQAGPTPELSPSPEATATATPSPEVSPSATPTPATEQTQLERLAFDSGPIMDLAILGKLELGGGLIVSGPAQFKDRVLFAALTEFGGDVTFQRDVTFAERPTFNSDTAGRAEIAQGTDSVTVTFSREYATAPIVMVNLMALHTTTDNAAQRFLQADYRYVVAEPNATSFTILLNKPAAEDITFSWLAVSAAKTASQANQGTPVSLFVSPSPGLESTSLPSPSPDAVSSLSLSRVSPTLPFDLPAGQAGPSTTPTP
jgi:fibronectin-binding autotransporter adhesin